MNKIIIKQAFIVNEGEIKTGDVLIANERIEKIATHISDKNASEIDATGLYLMPGVIDDQVHFREPGLTHKGDLYTESRAAVAGGITSFMDMPNTIPNTISIEQLEEKYKIASNRSLANYSFFMGVNEHNLEEVLKIDTEKVCGISDDGLYMQKNDAILANHPEYLEKLFSRTNTLIALHSEDEYLIKNNIAEFVKQYGENIPVEYHPLIRSREACLRSTKQVIEIAKKHKNRLHLLHISTGDEAELFDNSIPVREKLITSEACIHHLWFSDKDYSSLGPRIKWNPAVKTEKDKHALLKALLTDKIDIIATDHAPHLINEKNGNYLQMASGGPLVQHALTAMLEFFQQELISLEKIVEKMCHHVAEIYKITHRGYIREGYYADLVLVNLDHPWKVDSSNILYKCKWSPFENQIFRSSIEKTFVNGSLIYDNGNFNENRKGMRLTFFKNRTS
ncbi:MAG: dihydroorotase [bacterium]